MPKPKSTKRPAKKTPIQFRAGTDFRPLIAKAAQIVNRGVGNFIEYAAMEYAKTVIREAREF